MCGIDFFVSVSVWFFEINSDSVRNEFDSVQLKRNAVRFGYYSFIYYSCKQLSSSFTAKYYSNSG